jgi:hypothetical protein
MKRTNKVFLYSLTSLAVVASSAAYAQQMATAPRLEGGVTASIGALLVAPSADAQDYGFTETSEFSSVNNVEGSVLEVNPDFDWGLDASLGYVFEDTANSLELSYRWINSSDNDSAESDSGIISPVFGDSDFDSAQSELSYELDALDLMFNQFLDIGRNTQVRFGVGAAYLDLEKEQNNSYYGRNGEDEANTDTDQVNSQFSGIGPRVSIDGRYGFGDSGWGVLGGGSLAYYVGELDFNENITQIDPDSDGFASYGYSVEDTMDNHGVTNIRANVAIDYVFFFENDESTLGLELGYLFDFYDNAILDVDTEDCSTFDGCFIDDSETVALSFSGPYLNLKGVF